MLYLVCYDISGDAVRSQMAKRLLDFGVRIQESVFECLVDDDLYDRMLGAIGGVGLAETDRVRLYRICGKCVDTVQIYGPGEVARDPDYYLV
jgi:CRISPR-associated protein Cas2